MRRFGLSRGRGRIGAPVIVVPFPSGIAGLFASYLGDTGITLTNAHVSTWADQSGNARNRTQGTDANRPTYTLTQHGHAIVSASGTQSVGGSQLAVATDVTVLAVIRTTSSASSNTYAGDAPLTLFGDSTGGVRNGFGIGSGKIATRTFTLSGWVNVNGNATINDGAAHLVAMTQVGSNAGSGAVSLYVDGNADASGTAVPLTSGWAFDSIGRGQNAADGYVGDICVAAIYSAILTAPQLAQWHAYARSYWGTP